MLSHGCPCITAKSVCPWPYKNVSFSIIKLRPSCSIAHPLGRSSMGPSDGSNSRHNLHYFQQLSARQTLSAACLITQSATISKGSNCCHDRSTGQLPDCTQ